MAEQTEGLIFLRDYKYLDADRLADYMSRISIGLIAEWQETVRDTSNKEGKVEAKAGLADWLPFAALHVKGSGGLSSEAETIVSRTVKTSPEYSFNQFFEELAGRKLVKSVDADEPIDLEAVRLGSAVEIFRNFVPLLSSTTEHLLNILDGQEDERARELFRTIQSQSSKRIPMVFRARVPPTEVSPTLTEPLDEQPEAGSPPEPYQETRTSVTFELIQPADVEADSASASGTTPPPLDTADSDSGTRDVSVVYVCDQKFIEDQADLTGNMVVCGKITDMISGADRIDLLDLIGIPSPNELRQLCSSLHKRISSQIEELQDSKELAKADPEPIDWLTRLIRQIQGYEQKQEENRTRQEKDRQDRLQQATKEKQKMEVEWERIEWGNTIVPGPAIIVAPLAVYN